MTEQYRCNECGHFVEVPDDAICEVCNVGIMQHLRYTRGGDGSHWEGCDETHWDCKIAKLEKELARSEEERNAMAEDNRMLSERIQRLVEGAQRKDEIIQRLKEDAEGLAGGIERVVDYTNNVNWCNACETANDTHKPDCPITLHRQLMKELEEK